MKLTINNVGAALAAATLALSAFPASAQYLNTEELANLPLGGHSHDLWAEGDYVYVARGEDGVDVINAADKENPYKVATIRPFPGVPNIDIGDVEVVNGIAYMANTVPNGSPTPHVGVFMYDVSNPAAPVEVGRIEWGAGAWYHLGANAHNLHIHENGNTVQAYVASRTSSAVEVFDVTNPAGPLWLSSIYPPLTIYGTIPGQSHEIFVQGNLCFSSWLGAGFAIHDVSNPAFPVLVAHENYAGAYTYGVYPTDDGQHLLTTDAYTGIGLRIWDISTPSNPVLTGSWTSGTGALMHNVVVKGDYAYLSHFQDGMHVLDISNKAAPTQLAWFDTDPGSAAYVGNGAYGVFPTDEAIYVSHSTSGLHVLGLVDTVTINSADWFRRTNQLVVEATSSLAPAATLTLDGYGTMTYQPGSGTYTITVAENHKPRSVQVDSDFGGRDTSRVRKR
ncbi:MAG: hypothetical protein O3A87_00490 [Verrucomicrobia bacterium]|nr:hypothetical protein [Verrucomicrobiota bacterium]MDA1004946.1 hypothetical protein [Verrucomicrobiota bacterium]